MLFSEMYFFLLHLIAILFHWFKGQMVPGSNQVNVMHLGLQGLPVFNEKHLTSTTLFGSTGNSLLIVQPCCKKCGTGRDQTSPPETINSLCFPFSHYLPFVSYFIST